MGLEEITHLMIIIPGVFSRKLEQKFLAPAIEELDLDLAAHHLMILAALQEKGTMFIHDVCANLSISKSQMTFSADKLVSLGLVDRTADFEDRRKIRLSLTLRGRWVIEEIHKSIQRSVSRSLADISQAKLAQTEDALERLLDLSKLLD